MFIEVRRFNKKMKICLFKFQENLTKQQQKSEIKKN